MKSLVIFASLLVAAYATCEIPDAMKAQTEECLKEAGMQANAKVFEVPSLDDQLKSVAVCAAKKIGTMIDGKLHLDKSIDLLMSLPDADDTLKPRITECVMTANNESDEGEVVNVMHKCFFEKICGGMA